jgi:hypothetical protein
MDPVPEQFYHLKEYRIRYYDGGRPVNVVNIMEFSDGKVALETLYFAYPIEPPN